jgi:hypothetical protein
MPEYLAPGVFVEEVSYRSKSIEGVSTTTTGFIGPTRYGPLDQELEVITSLVEFERTYGDGERLVYGDVVMDNFMWHATRAFFEQGGKRLYVRRVYHAGTDPDKGHSTGWLPASAATATTRPTGSLRLRARFPGAAGDRRVRITLSLGPNILGGTADAPRVAGLREHDVVWISDQPSPPATSPPPAPGDTGSFYLTTTKPSATGPQYEFEPLAGGSHVKLSSLTPSNDPGWSDKVRVVTATITIYPNGPTGDPHVWGGLPLDYRHEVAGARDSLMDIFAVEPSSRALARTVPITIDDNDEELDGGKILQLFLNSNSGLANALPDPDANEHERSIDLVLTGGDDGVRPLASDYSGEGIGMAEKAGLKALADIEDISIIAAPGSTFDFEGRYRDDAATIIQHLIGHAELMRYRIAVLDSGNGQTLSDVQEMRGALDSKHAAFYYPWVRILDPITQRELDLPPSGYICGIYARNDINRAVYKAPANEVVTGAIGFERLLNKAQQEVLNPQGINCFRFFEGRGYRLWGARTISSDPEWKYVNVRRYFAYLEHSIDRGTQWAVFEPNGDALWANVRRTIGDFLFNEFVSGALLGTTPDTAYFVKCDRSTMTQNDLDNGRLVCLIGVAVVKPAEFVIFRIGQWTGDRKV